MQLLQRREGWAIIHLVSEENKQSKDNKPY